MATGNKDRAQRTLQNLQNLADAGITIRTGPSCKVLDSLEAGYAYDGLSYGTFILPISNKSRTPILLHFDEKDHVDPSLKISEMSPYSRVSKLFLQDTREGFTYSYEIYADRKVSGHVRQLLKQHGQSFKFDLTKRLYTPAD